MKQIALPALLVAMTCSAGGCAGSSPRTFAAGSGTDPGSVAVVYTNASIEHDFAAAEKYVSPGYLREFRGVAALAPKTTGGHASVRAGRVQISGGTAHVELVGEICPAGTHCVSNSDTTLHNPGFTVTLRRSATGQWQVVFNAPPNITPPSSGSATGFSSAAAGSSTSP